MIKRINGRFFTVNSLYLKGGEILTDCLICFADNFVIVAHDATDIKATWYNTDQVQKMEGVETESERGGQVWKM